MRTPTHARPLRPVVALAAAVALVASACGADDEPLSDDPEVALAEALDNTFDDSFAFELSVDIGDEARSRIAAEDPDAGPFLQGLNTARLRGRVAGGGTALSVEVFGTNFGEIRVFEDAFYLQVNVQAIAEFAGFRPAELEGALAFFPLPPDVSALATAALRGDWIGLVDLDDFDPSALGFDDELDPEEAEQLLERLRERYGDVRGLVEQFATVTERDAPGDARVFDLVLDLHGIVREGATVYAEVTGEPPPQAEVDALLAELPATVGGLEVTVQGAVVTQIVLDFGVLAQALDDPPEIEPGDVRLMLGLSDHGRASSVDRPDATTLTGGQLQELVSGMFDDFFGGFGDAPAFDAPDAFGDGEAAEDDAQAMAEAQES